MVICQSSELDWEVTVELPADFLSLGRGVCHGMSLVLLRDHTPKGGDLVLVHGGVHV